MTRETRIGVLVGLGFIIMFGLVLTELTGTGKPTPPPSSLKDVGELAFAPVEEISPAVVNGREMLPRLGQPIASPPEPATGTLLMASASEPPTAPGTPPAPPKPAEPQRKEPEVVAIVHRTTDTPPPVALQPPKQATAPQPAPAAAPPVVSAAEPPRITPGSEVVAVTAAAAAKPTRKYTVQPKDSLTKIARKVYGAERGGEYRRIFEANRDKLKNPQIVSVGQELVIPELDARTPSVAAGVPNVPQVELGQLAKALSSGEAAGSKSQTAKAEPVKVSTAKTAKATGRTVYVVRRGDTLSKIARRTLKDDSKAAITKIVKANKDKLSNPNRLPVGLRLEIPS